MMKTCPNCDEDLDEDMIALGVCEHCGEAFDEADLQDEEEDDLEEDPEEGAEEDPDDEEDEDDLDEEEEEDEDEDEDGPAKKKKGRR